MKINVLRGFAGVVRYIRTLPFASLVGLISPISLLLSGLLCSCGTLIYSGLLKPHGPFLRAGLLGLYGSFNNDP